MEAIVDVIIPTCKPGSDFADLMKKLAGQSMPIGKIIIMNTEEKYLERLKIGNTHIWNCENVEIHHLSRLEFDHGNTRNVAVKKSTAPYFVCMTQDAVPVDGRLLEKLLAPLLAGEAAVSYGRQLPRPDCDPIERFARAFNYPDVSRIKGEDDIGELGIKTFFCSNACAAYRRSTFDELGGFIRHTIFNEDMIYAAGVIRAGEKIAYVADAQVVHSHNYTWKHYFHRYFDLGVSQADHPEVFASVKSESEGMALIKETARYLKETGNGRLIVPMLWMSGWKYLGYRLGRSYRKLPAGLVMKCSMNKNYWHSLSER